MVDTRKHRHYFERRCALTGETHAKAVEGVRADGAAIPLIPDAASMAQTGFEARVLLALGKAMLSGAPTGDPRDPAVDRGPFGIMASLPTRNTLTLVPSRHPATFAELVLRLITLHDQESDDAPGVAGLRLTFTRDHTILRDTIHGGRITMAGVTERDRTTVISKELDVLGPSWRALIRPGDPIVSTHSDSGLLLDLGDRRDQIIAKLLSATLRRAHLFHTMGEMNFVDLWDNSSGDRIRIEVEWSGDLPHGHIMNRITDSLFGLPLRFDRDEFSDCVCDPCLYLRYSVPLRHHDPGTDAVVHLRRSSLYDDEPNPNHRCAPKEQTLRR